MGWQLIQLAADLPDSPVSTDQTQAVTVALIAALGTVLVALIGWASSVRSSRTSPSPPVPDPKLGERVAVLADHDENDRRSFDQLDRHVDGVSATQERHGMQLVDHEKRLIRMEQQMDRMGQAWQPDRPAS